ncbi:MAG: peptide-methionine (S)-S-oxide reductase [Promethearchaeota archaeon]|nr:MAG: peptide-methionine (S)-S-oxide reductase [Candidatus Lokiarchaeota archaeon]
MNNNTEFEKATLGGGCFWCLEAAFKELKGVIKVISGYAGGSVKKPTYRQVCSGSTGHAEVVQIIFDPSIITYDQILNIFFSIHDPTTINRQGNDVGTQYRSILLYHSNTQKEKALSYIQKLEDEKVWKNKIVTEVEPLQEFYPAEDYHQDYYENNPSQPYCSFVINPKMSKFRKRFSDILSS